MKINWIKKLTSRKFWTAVASFVSMMLMAFGGTEAQATQITALIMAGASVVAYIIGEGLADAASAKTTEDTAGIETVIETVKYPDGTVIKMKPIEATEGVYNELESK